MKIIELTSFSDAQLSDMQKLMAELSVHPEKIILSRSGLEQVVRDPGCHLYCMMEGESIIACATLCVYNSPSGRKASIEDVVVASDHRGQHLGRQLMEHLIAQARLFAPIELCLTSRPSRLAANRLYQSLGFTRKETNSYRMVIE